jgi:hypothetical protein
MKKYTNKIVVAAGIFLLALTTILIFIEWKTGKWERIDPKTYYNQSVTSVEVDDDGRVQVIVDSVED